MRSLAKHAWTSRMRPYSHDRKPGGGPGDYLPTERLAADSLAEHSFWVYNKAGVVIPLSAWARHNCGVLY
jgi:hypothetical protein